MPMKLDVVIGMPAFNEEPAIESFLDEIVSAFDDLNFRVVVVDDCSTDNTSNLLRSLASSHRMEVYTNQRNSGHGPATLKALKHGSDLLPKYVLATDGDGHVRGTTLRRLYDAATNFGSPAVVEGVRTQREDPWFRGFVSAVTRALVKCDSGIAPLDANTPFRVYPAGVIRELLKRVPIDHMTPNLLISTLVRRENLPVVEFPIEPYRRDGAAENGSTWRQRFKPFPSRRFLQFCVKAATQWLRRPKAAGQ